MGAPSATQIEASTPADRNRYADALRMASLTVVVVGHWLMAVVTLDDGRLGGTNLLVAEPWTRWLTWGLQVMPVFFFVGGYANAVAYSRARDRGITAADFIRVRGRRLMRPVVPLLAVWVPLVAVLAWAGLPEGLLRLGSQNAIVPAWFLATYLVIAALVPATYRLHERFGAWVLLAGILGAAVVDALHRAGVPAVGWLNFVLVWGTVHQAGYLWRDGRLPRRLAPALGLAAAGLAVLVALTQLAGYPISMVGVDGAVRSNNLPPSQALVALGAAQVGLLMAARPAVDGLLARPRVWAGVVRAGAVTMTVFLWHMTALLAAAALLYPTGVLQAADGRPDATWWAQRPLWLAACAVLLAALVRAMARFEQAGAPRPRASTTRALAGVAATAAGLTGLVLGGLYDPQGAFGIPAGSLVLLIGGLAALGVLRRPGRGPTAPAAPAAEPGGARLAARKRRP